MTPNRRRNTIRQMHASSSFDAPNQAALPLPAISDARSIQQAIAAVLQAVAQGSLEPPRARVLLYGLQIAATNARRIAADKAKASETEVKQAVAGAAQGQTPVEVSDPPAFIEAAQEDSLHEDRLLNGVACVDEELIDEEAAVEAPAGCEAPLSFEGEPEPEAAAPAVGYTGDARHRLLAFRQRSAAS